MCCRFNIYMENKKRKFVFLGRQTIKGNRCLLCQQTCPCMDILYQTGQYDEFTSLLNCRLRQFTERTSRVYVTCVVYIKNFP